MYANLHQSTESSGNDRTVEILWQRALSESTPEAREAAAWDVFVAAEREVTGWPAFKPYELPAEIRPLLVAARDRAAGRSPLDTFAQLSLSSDEDVRKAVARALVRLSLASGDWDRNRQRALLEGLKECGGKVMQHAVQDAYDELSPKNLKTALRRLRSSEPDNTVWAGLLGLGVLTMIGIAMAWLGITTGYPIVFYVGTFFLGRWLFTLWNPGQNCNSRHLKRRLELLAQIEAHADEDPEALRCALPELRALSWRLSDEPRQVREAAARLVQRIKATERDTRQLPIAAAQPSRQTEALPLPSEAGTGHE